LRPNILPLPAREQALWEMHRTGKGKSTPRQTS
jgi:hypothetical protein